MRIRYIAVFVIILLLVLPIYQNFAITTMAQNDSQSQFAVTIVNDTVIATNYYYSIKFNLTWGARIVDWNISINNQQIDLIQSDTFYPSLNFISYTGDTPTESFIIRNGNDTANATYPYPLMYLPWNATLAYNGSEMKIVKLTPSTEASTQLGSLELTEYVILYDNKPYIDVFYTLSNPTENDVPLQSNMAGYGIVIEFSAYTGLSDTPKWNHTYKLINITNVSEVFNHTLKSQGLQTIETENDKVFYIGAFHTQKGYVSLVTPLYREPAIMKFTRTFLLGTKLPIYALGYAINGVPAYSNVTVGLRVLYLNNNPYWLSQLNAGDLSSIIDNETYSLFLKYRDNFTVEIKNLNNTIKNQNDYIKFLQERAQNATSQLNEARENASYWKTEYNVLKQQLNEKLSMSKLSLAKALAIAIVGLAIGFYGGRVFSTKRR
ncbi:MAG: hypothetical protein F7C32_00775 [Desulfurococcales archaeon]|nr:hypothetical protein [Desulfurococcales archaeon]